MPIFLVSNFSASVHLPQHDDESISRLLQTMIRLMWHIALNFTITFANTPHMLHLSCLASCTYAVFWIRLISDG